MAPDTAGVVIAAPRSVELGAVRAGRRGRLRQELKARDYAGARLYDPINIRYACDASNMQVWCLHNAVRYVFVQTEGPVVLFDFHNCAHLSAGNEMVSEVRPADGWFYFAAGNRCRERVGSWVAAVGIGRESGWVGWCERVETCVGGGRLQ